MSTMPDPLSELDLMLAAASQTPNDSVRELFVARARNAHTEAKRRLDAAERALTAQETDLERTRR